MPHHGKRRWPALRWFFNHQEYKIVLVRWAKYRWCISTSITTANISKRIANVTGTIVFELVGDELIDFPECQCHPEADCICDEVKQLFDKKLSIDSEEMKFLDRPIFLDRGFVDEHAWKILDLDPKLSLYC